MAEIDQPRPASAWTSTSSPCVSIGRGLSAAGGLHCRQQRVGPRPIRWTRPSGWPDPGAQTWGDSVISSGDSADPRHPWVASYQMGLVADGARLTDPAEELLVDLARIAHQHLGRSNRSVRGARRGPAEPPWVPWRLE